MNTRYCPKHERMIVLHSFSEGKCLDCGEAVQTEHIPCDTFCKECAIKGNKCQYCGESLTKLGEPKAK